jgi:hypothetical protein
MTDVEAFDIYQAGWRDCLARCGGFTQRYETILDWEKIRMSEFRKFWLEHTEVWKAQMELEQQRVAHNLERHRGSPLTVPTELPMSDEL